MHKVSKKFKITKSEKEFADDNKQLIGFSVKRFIENSSRKHGRIPYSWEELYSAAYEGMINSIRYYEEKKGEFSSFAVTVMNNQMCYYVREDKRYTTYFYVKEDKDLYDVVQSNDTTITNRDFKMVEAEIDLQNGSIFYNVLFALEDREHTIITKLFGLLGHKKHLQRELASEFNLTQAAISKIRDRVLLDMKEKIVKKYKKINKDYTISNIMEDLQQEISFLTM